MNLLYQGLSSAKRYFTRSITMVVKRITVIYILKDNCLVRSAKPTVIECESHDG